MLKRLFSLFKPVPVPIIIVGTDYLSFQLGSSLTAGQRYAVRFFINQAPWHHKTTMLGGELRYENELLALVRRHDIKAVCCVLETDYLHYQAHFQEALALHQCQLLFCKEDADSLDLLH